MWNMHRVKISLKKVSLWLSFSGMLPFAAYAQSQSVYNKLNVFDQHFFTHSSNELRNANGAPGPKYWQNRADYTIHASLIESDTLIKGNIVINYTNNSTDTLNYL